MSVLSNSHQALLRNRDRLSGRFALLGLADPVLLQSISGSGLVMTDNAGVYNRLPPSDSLLPAFGYDDPALAAGAADTALIFLPKSRAELSLRLALALWLIRADGRVILIGEKKEGIAGAVRQMKQALPQAEKVDSARHCQVWLADHVSPSKNFRLADWMRWYAMERHGVALEVAGLPGIFSDNELDAGTALLLDTLAQTPLASGKTLDFACGAGIIGAWWQLFQARNLRTISAVDGIDVQFQAVACARATYKRAGVQGTIRAFDGLGAKQERYQSVVANPPFHTGVRTDTSVTEAFLSNVSGQLVTGGELRLVANRFLPYKSLICGYIGEPRVLAEDRSFIVWSAKKKPLG